MEVKTIARIGALAFAAVAITMTAIEMRAGHQTSLDPIPAAVSRPGNDPLLGEMLRCQSMGQAAASDEACLRAWAENRRRFLAPGGRRETSLPDRVGPPPTPSGVTRPVPESGEAAMPAATTAEEH